MVAVAVTGNLRGFELFLVGTGLVGIHNAEIILVPSERHGVIAILVGVVARFADIFTGSAGVIWLVVVFLLTPVQDFGILVHFSPSGAERRARSELLVRLRSVVDKERE